jgi:hypothetical protein
MDIIRTSFTPTSREGNFYERDGNEIGGGRDGGAR